MNPIEFKHQNHVFGANQPEYKPLPVTKFDSQQGEVVSCWKMSWKERLKVLITGEVWVCIMTYNSNLQPQYLATRRQEIFKVPEDNLTFYQKVKKSFKSWLKNYKWIPV